jgi:hypothetical protein
MEGTIPHRAPLAEAEVERMRDHERGNVARPVDDDGAVTLDRKSGSPSSQARAAAA